MTKQAESEEFVIYSPRSVKKFVNSTALDFEKFEIASVEIYLSNLVLENEIDIQKNLEKRKKFFINLFTDDEDPYTHKKIQRKVCLKNIGDSKVDFISGPNNLWSDCRMNKVSDRSKQVATRRWYICGRSLWEITLKSIDLKTIESIQIDCSKN